MKRFKLLVLTFLLILSTLSPMTVHAEGNGNINNGGGGLGEGTGTNFWNTGDEGVRVTVVSASDGSAVSASIDLTNKQPNDIRVQFGKVCKSQYRSGTVLTPDTGSYSYINPTQSLPKIITTSSGSASLAAIKSYFTDEQVIRSIAGYVGMNYDTLIGGDYKLLLEPIAYVTFEGVRTAFTATEAAMYNQVRGGMLRKKLTSLTHKNLPLAMFLETSDLGYPAWGGGKNQKVSDDEIIGSLGLGIVRFNEVVTPEVIAADYEYRVDTDVVTTVTISGGQSDPDHPVSVTFSILGRNYTVNNVYYPEDGQQLVWVKWHTPSTEQYITINVSVSGGGSASKGTITANIVDLDRNPPPNPVADDRNDSYNAGNAIIPANPQKTSASWSVWRPWWKEKWVWHSDWKFTNNKENKGVLTMENNNNLTQENRAFKKEDAYETLGIINTWIGNMDTKVSFALALAGVLIGVIFEKGLPRAFHRITEVSRLAELSGGEIIATILVALLYLASFISILCFMLSIIARVKNLNNSPSIFFFGSIGSMTLENYKNAVKDMNEREIVDDLEEQIHTNSKICSLKAKWYSKGIKFLLATVILWFVCMIFQL